VRLSFKYLSNFKKISGNMAVVGDLVLLGIAFLIAPAIAEYANLRKKAEKGFNFIGAAGLLFLFAGVFGTELIPASLAEFLGNVYLREIFYGVGAFFALIGAVYGAWDILTKK